jgi:hypothetical protein
MSWIHIRREGLAYIANDYPHPYPDEPSASLLLQVQHPISEGQRKLARSGAEDADAIAL